MPLLVVHGAGGGHDQGMEFLTHSRLGVIANDTLWLPAYSNACKKSAVIGISAGAPSAMQVAISYLNRVSALVLIVPIAYKPSTLSNSAPPLSRWTEKVLMHLIWSVFVFWIALHVARAQVIKYVLATLPELVTNENQQE